MIAWVIGNWKLFTIAVLVYLLTIGGMFTLYKVTASNLKVAKAEVIACQDANKSMNNVLIDLQAIQKEDVETCDKRTADKDKEIARLNKIKNLKGGTVNAESSITNSGDDILDALRGM